MPGKPKEGAVPLVCVSCCREYHIGCAGTQRQSLEMASEAGTWRCVKCVTRREAADPSSPTNVDGAAEAELRRGVRLLQWNCDWMATKRDELQELLKKQKIDIATIQETKLLPGDRTPHLEGHNVARRDRPGRYERGEVDCHLQSEGVSATG